MILPEQRAHFYNAKVSLMVDYAGLFKKSPYAIFFSEINSECLYSTRIKIKTNQEEKDLFKKAKVTTGECGLVSQTKLSYGDFLKTGLRLPQH